MQKRTGIYFRKRERFKEIQQSSIINDSNYDTEDFLSEESFRELDGSTRIIAFPNQEQIFQYLKENNFKNIEIQKFQIVNYYANSFAIMKELKSIGASYKDKIVQPLNKTKFCKLNDIYYNKFYTKSGLPLTWKIFLVSASK